MLRNLLKTRKPAPTLHFNLTFHRTGSMLPRFALASLHPHGSSPCLLTSSRRSKGCSLAEELGISIPYPSGAYTLTHMYCPPPPLSSPTPPPQVTVLHQPAFAVVTWLLFPQTKPPVTSPRPEFVLFPAVDQLRLLFFPEVRAPPQLYF